MTLFTYRNSVKVAYLTAILSVILLPDVVVGLLFELMHLLFEGIHLLFECTEMLLDECIEHLFHTGLHQTQVIVFYILCTMGTFILYRLTLAVTRYYKQVHEKMLNAWAGAKLHFTL